MRESGILLAMRKIYFSVDRGLLWLEASLAKHRRRILWGYSIVAFCFLLYEMYFSYHVASFAVGIPTTELQNALVPVREVDDRLLHFAMILHRQSVASTIFADFAHVLPEVLFCMPLISIILIDRKGRVPCFLKITGKGIHWSCWLMLCFVVFASAGHLVSEITTYFLESKEIMTSDLTLCEMFRLNPDDAIEIMFARRRILMTCAAIHSIGITGTAILFVSILLLRIAWAGRYAHSAMHLPIVS